MAPADTPDNTPYCSEESETEEQMANETQALDTIEEALDPEFLNEEEQIRDFLRRLDASTEFMISKLLYERNMRKIKHKQRVIRRLRMMKMELVNRLQQLDEEEATQT
jgi:hypothetical protein